MNPFVHNTLMWIGLAISLGISWLFSGMEAGVFALSRVRVRQQMRTGSRSARVLHGYLENPENFLWTILVGNTLANFVILGWLVVVLHRELGASIPLFVAAYALLVFVFYALFDLLPKTLFRMFPNRLCLVTARPFGLFVALLKPLVVIVESFSILVQRWSGGHAFTGRLFGNREEFRFLMQESSQALTSDEKALVNRVLDFQSLTVRQAMKPMSQVATLPQGATVGEALKLCRDLGFTRFPVWGERDRKKSIIGLVSAKAMLYEAEPPRSKMISAYLKPAVYLEQDLRLEVALRRLQRSGQRLAVVLGRHREELGIITLEDVLRAIFGEVRL